MGPKEVVLVPGVFEAHHIWRKVKPSLEKQGYGVTIAPLISTGKTASADPKKTFSMFHDIATIRAIVSYLVDEGKDVLIVAHSAGGYLSAHATEGLGKKARAEKGLSGGVFRFAFISAGLLAAGTDHPNMDHVFYSKDGEVHIKNTRETLFSDMSDEEAAQEARTLACQPDGNYYGTCEYAGWTEIPSSYLVLEGDQTMPPPLQRQLSELASCDPIVSLQAGHCAPLTQPEAVVDFIQNALNSA